MTHICLDRVVPLGASVDAPYDKKVIIECDNFIEPVVGNKIWSVKWSITTRKLVCKIPLIQFKNVFQVYVTIYYSILENIFLI